MVMRLLKPQEGQNRKQSENATLELRAQQLDQVIKDKRKEINDLDIQLVNSLSEIGTKNYEEEQQWKSKIRVLTQEVEALESRRKSALLPLEEREKKVQDRESVLLKREENLAIKESDVEQIRELLEDKLDTVSEREEEATKYSITLNNREFAIQLQEKQISERMNALTDTLKESYGEIQKAKTQIAEREAFLKGRDVSITERERNVDIKEASFANREKAITDRYNMLLRTITETNLKDNVISNRRIQQGRKSNTDNTDRSTDH